MDNHSNSSKMLVHTKSNTINKSHYNGTIKEKITKATNTVTTIGTTIRLTIQAGQVVTKVEIIVWL